jgi:tol-pal system protein YbgF
MTSTSRRVLAGLGGLAFATMLTTGADAHPVPGMMQAAPAAIRTQAPPPPQPKPQAKPSAAPKSAAKEDTAGARTGDAQLRQRVEQLEEQLTDMQVTMGTLESLGRGAAGGAAAPQGRPSMGSGGGVDQARLDSLETQIRALTSQIEQLAEQVRQMGQGRRSEAAPVYQPPAIGGPPASAPGGRFAAATQPAPAPYRPGQPPAESARAQAPGFGQVTINPGGEPNQPGDAIGALIGTEPGNDPSAPPAQLPAGAASASTAKELYETAYGYLLQQDYGASEVAFDEFLRRYPGDRLAPDAQYWLGEALYVQRRYKPAGQAFLSVIQKHATSAKVPSSMLKLAMTLEQLGTKDCALFIELETRQPNATPDIKAKARAVKQRVGC